MFSRLNHLAIVSDHYTLIGMFYRAVFGMRASGDITREMTAISVGDGYVGMTLIPRPSGRYAGLDHFGIEVEDFDLVRARMQENYPNIEILKRPSNRPFASYSTHDPAGNYFDLSQQGDENRAEVYAGGEWTQDRTISHFAIRTVEPERIAEFYTTVFELTPANAPGEDGGYHLTDGRVTLAVLPWKISLFEGSGVEQPGMDHIGFRVESVKAFKADLEDIVVKNPYLAPKSIGPGVEGPVRRKLLARCPHGSFQLTDPDGTWIDVAEG
jgi:predicted enzyme related to lactoylglutathione lyase